MRHRLIVEQPVETRTATGAERISFAVFDTVWAWIEPAKGGEPAQTGQQLVGVLDTKIGVRWSPRMDQVAAKWRLRFAPRGRDGVVYDIIAQPAHVNLGHREIHFACRSGVASG